MIRDAWKEMSKEHRQEWIKTKDTTKEKILAQRKSHSSGPVTKNHQLRTDGRTVYKLDFLDEDDNGYYSDCTANSEAHTTLMPPRLCMMQLMMMTVIGRVFWRDKS